MDAQSCLTPSQPGKFPTCCLRAAAIVWDKYWMVQLTRMLWSELLSSSSVLVRECCQESSIRDPQASLDLA